MTFSSFKVKPLALAVGTVVGLMASYPALSASNDIVVSTSTTGLTLTTGSHSSLDSVEITSTGALSGSFYGINNSTTIGSIINAGTISGSEGLFSTGTIGSIINSGLIESSWDAALWASGTTSTIDSIDNSGTINGAVAVVVQSGAHLGTLTNSGTISGSYGIANFGSGGTIDHIVNTGLISSNSAIYNADGTFGPITNSGVIAGDIYSASGLTFNGGEGSTFGTLTGYDQATQGNININSGDLVFASGNLLLNDNITVNSGVMSNQAAALQINNTVTLNGNYVQGSDASLLIGVADDAVATGDITTDSGYGRLVVSGTANIASGSTVSLVSLNNYAFANGQRYVVVQAAAEGTEYNASDLNYLASGYNGAITGSAQADSVNSGLSDLVVTLGTSGPSRNATTGNAISSINGLFNYGGTDTSLLNVFNASAALGSSEEANRAGARLSPAAVASASAQASSAPTNAILNVVSQRADAIRVSGGSSGVATGEGDSDVVMWGQGFGGKANQGQRSDVSGYDARFGGLLIGADGAVSDSWRLGGLGSYAATNVDSTGDNDGSTVRIKSYGLFGYANYEGRPWFLNLSTGVVRHQYDTQRLIDFSGFSGNATGSFNGMQYVVSGQTGYPFKLGATETTLTPIAGLTYSILKQQGYTESGGNGAGLTVGDATSTSLKSDVALKLDRRIALSGGEVQPFIQLGWRHEFHDDAMQSAASFAADSTGATDFVTTGSRPVADSGVLSVGTTIVSQRNLSLTLKYTGEAARSYESHSGNLQVRWQF
ncbi:autotransporter domain-containing protein [Pectobacterium brasiliense]|uniref:autotransporter family protein n=1 Tax=Pectobacterium brasiliense TaxID=180957 RepID=UPI0015DFAE75|nr:autotransporter domain-containing protein [Pectobacterium brasiliense]MBA0195845.1 autotransporter domain-containing protein [Pectobacterium brasiliense]MBN3094213.1 autotransporter domain-containing protein [Pectobacterium brasiliense]MBN3139804.1 autotransporter domain-containing protein [Pectobacterium brasiliense]MBW5897415.1 autotransporter domain-containing protein [Pectobacterium brasiliense]UDQ76472.1 autotransporter domain-containing protein [Pectobacterium brasiliense]